MATPPSATRTATPLPAASPDDGTPAATETGLSTPDADEWQPLADAPLALTEVASAAHAGEAWFAGGLAGDGRAVATVLIYDPASGTWREGPSLPEAVHHAALVSTGSDLYLIGGYGGSGFGSPVADVRSLDADGGGWIEGPALPAPRAAGAAAWDGSRLVYAGGAGPDGVSAAVLALHDDSWSEIGTLAAPREHFAAASDGAGTTLLMGGRSGGLDTNVGTVDLLRGDSLESLGDPLTPRSGVAAFWTPAKGACLAGGEGQAGTFAEVECVTADGQLTMLPPLSVARHGLGAAVLPDGVVVALGGPQPGLFVSAAAELLSIGR